MTRCPTCEDHPALVEDQLGGIGRGPGAAPARRCRLCPVCWTVFPVPDRHLHAVPEVRERRDLS